VSALTFGALLMFIVRFRGEFLDVVLSGS